MGQSKNKQISAALWKKIKPLLPRVKPSPKGGRPRLDDELALNGILFVLRTGILGKIYPRNWASAGLCNLFSVNFRVGGHDVRVTG